MVVLLIKFNYKLLRSNECDSSETNTMSKNEINWSQYVYLIVIKKITKYLNNTVEELLIRSILWWIISAGMTRWAPQVSLHEALIALLCGRLIPSRSPSVRTTCMMLMASIVPVATGTGAMEFVAVVMAVFLVVLLVRLVTLRLLWLLVSRGLNLAEALSDSRVEILSLAAPSASSRRLKWVQISNAGVALNRITG